MNREEVMSKPKTSAKPAKATVADPFANTAWTVDVDIWLEPKGGKPFYLETYLPRTNDDIRFENHRRDGFIINFNLRGNTNFRFPNNLADALYSSTGPGCPTVQGQWPQFAAQGVTNGNRTLVVRNRNNGQQIFGYTLRVTDGTSWRDLDPGGDNQNGQSN